MKESSKRATPPPPPPFECVEFSLVRAAFDEAFELLRDNGTEWMACKWGKGEGDGCDGGL